MANALYDTGRNAFLTGDIAWDTDDIRVILVNTTGTGTLYTVDLVNHDFLDDVPAGSRVATSAASIASKTASAGIADGDDITFTSVSGDTVEAIIIYKHNASEAAAQLIAYIDTATGLPLTPNGGDVTIVWDSGTNKIFKL